MFEMKLPALRRYEASIEKLEQKPIEKGMILFVGSSGFGRWRREPHGHRPLEEDIRRKDGSPAAVNQGFGGSSAEEALYYYDRIIRPWEPRALVLRLFPNDRDFGYSPAEVVYLLARICAWAREDFPGIRLYLCDAAPGKAYMENGLWKRQAKQFNQLLEDYCTRHEDCTYLCHIKFPGFFNDPADVGDYGKIRTDIFVEDGVHFNQSGYDVYRDFFLQGLDDIL